MTRRSQSKRTPHAGRHLRLVEADDETELGVQPPTFIPMTEAREAQAIAALTVLFHDALAARRRQRDRRVA